MAYPREVYCINEDVTRENMRVYDARQKKLEAKCLELAPNYYKLGLRERYEIRQKAREVME